MSIGRTYDYRGYTTIIYNTAFIRSLRIRDDINNNDDCYDYDDGDDDNHKNNKPKPNSSRL